jgi:hypothetical protein
MLYCYNLPFSLCYYYFLLRFYVILHIYIYIYLLYLFQGTEMFNFTHNRNIHLLKFLNLLFVNIKYHLYFVYFYKLGICCFSAKYPTLRRKSNDWLAQNQDNECEWGDMSIRGLVSVS